MRSARPEVERGPGEEGGNTRYREGTARRANTKICHTELSPRDQIELKLHKCSITVTTTSNFVTDRPSSGSSLPCGQQIFSQQTQNIISFVREKTNAKNKIYIIYQNISQSHLSYIADTNLLGFKN